MMHSMLYTAASIALLFACSSKPGITTAGVPQSKMRVVHVANSDALQHALAGARPGDSVILADGVYSGQFAIAVPATEEQPFVLTGSRDAVLDGGAVAQGYGLHVQGRYCRLKGFTVRNSLKGIVADGTDHMIIDGVLVTHTGEEGIHLRKFSSDNTIRRCTVTHTGLKPERAGYGEGVYIGSAQNNWEKYSGGKPDRCDRNLVIQNEIGPGITAECIDIKEGTTGGVVSGNVFHATGISGENSADSWMDVKGNAYLITGNTGYNLPGSLLTDGYQVNCALDGWGNNNVFEQNHSVVNAPGYAIHVRLKSSKGTVTGTVVKNDNQQEGADKGMTNISTVP